LALLTGFLFPSAAAEREYGDPLQNYYALENLYTKWREGLFGSKNYYRREFVMLCTDLIDREIETGASFMLLSPESVSEKGVVCNLPHARWLYIHGPVDPEKLKEVRKNDPWLLKGWWRSTKLLRVKGSIRKFRLGRDRYGDTLHLWLHKVQVSE
jgi:hypothetical protein